MKFEISWQIFGKYSNTKFHESSSSGNRFLRANRRKDMTKLIFTFRNFANEFKKDRPIRCRWGQEQKHGENIMFIISFLTIILEFFNFVL